MKISRKSILLIIASMLMIVFVTFFYQKNGTFDFRYLLSADVDYYKSVDENKMYKCLWDSDCAKVPDGFCGCGGNGRAKAINKKYAESYKSANRASGIFCFTMMSDHPTCTTPATCENRKCVINYKNINSCKKSKNIEGCIGKMINKGDTIDKCNKTGKRSLRNYCIKTLAYKKEDVSTCNEISDRRIKQECKDDIYYRLSKSVDDYNYCYNISQESNFRAQCLFERIYTGDDETKCTLIGKKERITYCEDLILGRKGKESTDINTCYKITDPSRKNDCIKEVAIEKMDLDLCEEISNYKTSSAVRSNCISGIAVKKNDYKLCEKATHSNFSQHCRSGIIKKESTDLEIIKKICELQDERYWKGACYEIYAIRSGDNNWCERANKPDKCRDNVKYKSDEIQS